MYEGRKADLKRIKFNLQNISKTLKTNPPLETGNKEKIGRVIDC